MTFLLDTDTCVFWLRGYETVRKHLIAAKLENIAVSIITVAELRYGAVCSTHPEQHRAIDDFIGGVTVFGVNAETARSCRVSRSTWNVKRSGRRPARARCWSGKALQEWVRASVQISSILSN